MTVTLVVFHAEYEMEKVCFCIAKTPALISTLIRKLVVHDIDSNSAKVFHCLSRLLALEPMLSTMYLYSGADLRSWWLIS